ncbi:Non-specific serine/threonine protein kinase protein [Dioscorea alata]|uniref:Non-specific serine/threonine protein kinase protein n=1 Tax=Dioscorea alata TaxID=55571 RepID=A0ACB7WR90_DIOAL|nr:Non-specific serine/threonine protein kinase protein [Dioscorea alata]
MACLSLFVFLASLIVSAFPPCYVHGTTCIETERIALLSIKAGINHSDDQSLFSSWTGHDCCKWQGVSCNHQSRHVIKLDLRQHPSNVSYNFLMPPSKLNSSLIQLHHLKHLDLSMNNFNHSRIPDFIGSFAKLEYLNLSNAGFSGAIPHTFGNLSYLRYLDLSSYDFLLQANDLRWLSGMTSLHHLDLGGANLSKVHDWLHDINSVLPSLHVLKLSMAELQGGGIYATTDLPHYLNFTSLRVLDLSLNSDLNMTLPQWLFNLTSLVYLDLSFCALHGKLPVTIGNLSSLRFLRLSYNSFDGVIPESLGNLGSLETLLLPANELNGRIPESLSNLSNLVYFDVSGNQVQGLMPATIGDLRNLQYLDFSGNKFTGAIPESMGKLTSLKVLDLSMNNISGILPKSMGNLCKLQKLDLSSNLIKGAIDDLVNRLSNCPENYIRNSFFSEHKDGMWHLNVGNNRFNGTVPESIGRLANLRVLLLQENSFVGTLTEHHFANLRDLSEMDFSNNLLRLNVHNDWVPPFHADAIKMCSCRISSVLPAWLKTQTGLGSLCLSEAEISGNVPTWFWNLSSNSLFFLNISHNNLSGILPTLQYSVLDVIDMSHNKFEGLIPDLNSSLLNIVDLRNNSLFGPISLSFASANLIQVISLSHNHINGSIPFFLCNLTNLQALDLSSNNMSGELPHCWNQLSWLTIIDLSNNNFFGSIPEAVVSVTNLQSLHLQKNSLSGNLPLSLKNAKKLVVLDIGENTLSGTIPSWIGGLASLVVLRLR